MELTGQLHAPVPIEQKALWPQSRSGRFGEEKLSRLSEIEPMITQPVAQSLYQLSYNILNIFEKICGYPLTRPYV